MLNLKNRCDAGKQLSRLLEKYKHKDVVVYGLPRGGVVVAAEIAKYLHAPMDLILAHKIGYPSQPEYAIGAVSESGHEILALPPLSAVDRDWLEKEKQHQMQEIRRKRGLYLHGKRENLTTEKIAIVVDDGIATGLTMRAGIEELRGYHPRKIVVAVPMSPRSAADIISASVDDFIALAIPDDDTYLGGVGAYYKEFAQIEDSEVISLLAKHSQSQLTQKKSKNSQDPDCYP